MFIVKVNPDYCKGCGLCIDLCPKHIMAMTGKINDKGMDLAECAKPEDCIGCRSCAVTCPDAAITIEKQ
jgi:MinD superfamily P-loop ATPase containing an inserted ferredoxin domain